MFKRYRHIHFVGIGGIGMSGIAQVLLNLGYRVSGSDLKRSAVTRALQKRGAMIFTGHKKEHMKGAQVVVTSTAVNGPNPEVEQAKRLQIPVVPRAEMLAELMRMKYSIAIGGSHGKTTTTSMIGQVLTHAGLDPTLIIGGRVNNLRSNARLGRGEYLVAEADESDRSFLQLTPTIAVITNIDPEHMENYRNVGHLTESFTIFANKVPFYGAVVACCDHPRVRKLFPKLKRRLVTYGLKEGADVSAKDIVQAGPCMHFTVFYQGEKVGAARVCLPGLHHVSNALATVAVGRELDIPFPKILRGLRTFRGVGRRFEILAEIPNQTLVVDDYGHHPVEIAATLAAARQGWPKYSVVLILQPHRFTRLQALMEDFIDVAAKADRVVLLPVYAAGETPIPGVHSLKLFEMLRRRKSQNLFYAANEKELLTVLQPLAEKTLFLFQGAGNITTYARNFARKLGQDVIARSVATKQSRDCFAPNGRSQ